MIVILGNTNEPDGTLSPIAISRCDKAIDLWKLDKTKHVITTGTFGSHFNISEETHSYWLKKYLTENGVEESKILPNIISTNTFQDILGLRRVLLNRKVSSVTVITSDFHYGRVKFYSDLILHDMDLLIAEPEQFKIIGTPAPVSADDKLKLVKYENERMTKILEFPWDVYKNASDEQKHYDTVSNWMITGQLAVFAFGYKYVSDYFQQQHIDEYWIRALCILPVFLTITGFWMLYSKAARTARTARQTLRNIERCYSQYGFSLFYNYGHLKNKYFTFKRILEYLYLIISGILFQQVSFILSAVFLVVYFIVFYDKNDR